MNRQPGGQSSTTPQQRGPLLLRTIARALEKHLYEDPECALHWIAVVGEDSVDPNPTRTWDQVLEDSVLQIAVSDGVSEGRLIYIHGQRDRYAPGAVQPLWRIKVLCGHARAFKEAERVWSWFESPAFVQLKQQHGIAEAAGAGVVSQAAAESSAVADALSTSVDAVANLLSGYARKNFEELARLGQRSDWAALAQWEQTRRAASFLEMFDDRALARIAGGEIDVQALCRSSAEAVAATGTTLFVPTCTVGAGVR